MLKDKSSAKYQDRIAKDSDIWFTENACDTPRLTPEEEREYLLQIKAGDVEALQIFVEANTQLIYSVCKKFKGCGVDLGDLIQECSVLMIEEVIPRFNPDLGFRFSNYAKKSFVNCCLATIAHSGKPIKFRYEIKARIQFLSEFLDDRTLGTKDIEWRIEYIASVEKVAVERIIALLPFVKGFDSLARVLDENGSILLDRLESSAELSVYEQVENIWLQEKVVEALETQLTPDQKITVELRYGLDGGPCLEYKEIGQICGGICKEAVRQRLVKAYAKLRPYFEELPGLQAYFGNLEMQAE